LILMAEKAKYFFVLNPISGSRSRLNVPGLIQDHVRSAGLEAKVAFTEYAGHATALARHGAREGYQVVVAVGGDGTVNEVARGLLGTGSALGIIPRGSGNGLARHLGVPLDARRALKVLGQHTLSRIDSGSINGHPFFCTAGLGFDAHISSVFATSQKRGFRSYVELVLREFQDFEPSPFTASFEGQQIAGECFVLAFANAAQYGNNAFIAPNADIRDGLLDLCLISRLTLQSALEISIRLMTKQLASASQATYYTAKNIHVTCDSPVKFHVDGEYVGEATDFSVQISPASLSVLIPD
jgi:diacylglycerol kinase (ATP)